MLMPHHTPELVLPDGPALYTVLFLDGKKCPFKIGLTIAGLRQRFQAHRQWRGKFVTLRLWPVGDIRDFIWGREREAISVVRDYATGALGPECFDVPDIKKALRALDRWATTAGLPNAGPTLTWLKPGL